MASKDQFKEFGNRIVKYITDKEVFFNASAITFNIFLCAIPFTLLMISVLGYVLSFEDAFTEVLRYGRELFPRFTYESHSQDVVKGVVTLETILNPLIQKRRIFGIVGFGALVFFSQGLFHTLKHVVFFVFDINDRKHPIVELIYNFFTFGLVGGTFLFFSIVISIVSIISFDGFAIPLTAIEIKMNWFFDLINLLIPIAFTFFLIYVVFRYISEKRLNRHISLFGAIVFTVLFEGAKFGVGLYFEYAVTVYRYLYQGYTIAVVLIVWAFYTAVLFVVTTIIARAYKESFRKKTGTRSSTTQQFIENPYTSIS